MNSEISCAIHLFLMHVLTHSRTGNRIGNYIGNLHVAVT